MAKISAHSGSGRFDATGIYHNRLDAGAISAACIAEPGVMRIVAALDR